MERRKALALATTITCLVGSAAVAVPAVSGMPLLGFGAAHRAAAPAPVIYRRIAEAKPAYAVTRTKFKFKDVYDRVTVDSEADRVPSSPADLVSVTTPSYPVPTIGTAPPASPPPSGDESRGDDASDPESSTTSPGTSIPEQDEPESPSTTVAVPSTTTLPPGVSADWPSGKPIPPMPPDCRQPQLEDNGVWNCQDD